MRPTVHDLAEAAGVSLATVDRVLNNRPGVRVKTRAQVEEAIERIGYVRNVAAANLAKGRQYIFDFLIPDNDNSFMRQLRKTVEEVGAHLARERTILSVHEVPAFDAAALAQQMRLRAEDGPDGLVIVAVDAPEVHEAAAFVSEKGVPLLTLVSDLPGGVRAHYTGIDNFAAGKTAASLLGRFAGGHGGSIGVLAGSMKASDHIRRFEGFSSVMAAEYPHLKVLSPVEGHDDPLVAEEAVLALLEEQPDICGIYSLGAGNRGLLRALEKSGRAGEISVVAHELTATTRQALEAGVFDAVLNQDTGHEIRSAVRVLKAKTDGADILSAQERIRIDIYLRDNMPEEE